MHRRQFLSFSAVAATSPFLTGCIGGSDEFSVSLKQGFTDSGFGPDSTAESVTQGLDLSGKTMLVTGCNSGIGLETMRVLALRGAHVIGTGRTIEKAAQACASVTGKTTPLALELTSFDSVLACAESVQKLATSLDVLICNAGISGRKEKQLVNGVEKAFLINYLSHFLFANKLLPLVTAADQGRFVHVSSASSYSSASADGIRFNTLGESNGGFEYDSWEYYGQSKLANALFSRSLAKKLAGTNATSNALHPGFIKTNIARGQGWLTETAFDIFGPLIAKNVEEGAATTCYAASHPLMDKVNGEFLSDSNVVNISGEHHLEDDVMAERLWSVSEEMLADRLS